MTLKEIYPPLDANNSGYIVYLLKVIRAVPV